MKLAAVGRTLGVEVAIGEMLTPFQPQPSLVSPDGQDGPQFLHRSDTIPLFLVKSSTACADNLIPSSRKACCYNHSTFLKV
jgi:hypothetical protein